MDWIKSSWQDPHLRRKYGSVLLVLVLGICMMLLPRKQQSQPPAQQQSAPETGRDLQTQLEQLLSQMEGAGRVRVLLTEQAGEHRIYRTDESRDISDQSQSIRVETVILSDGSRAQQALVEQVIPPVYLGAVVLCQGAGSAAVRLSVVEAVSRATGLSTNQIVVLKMK